jgi:hypothetical protein
MTLYVFHISEGKINGVHWAELHNSLKKKRDGNFVTKRMKEDPNS